MFITIKDKTGKPVEIIETDGIAAVKFKVNSQGVPYVDVTTNGLRVGTKYPRAEVESYQISGSIQFTSNGGKDLGFWKKEDLVNKELLKFDKDLLMTMDDKPIRTIAGAEVVYPLKGKPLAFGIPLEELRELYQPVIYIPYGVNDDNISHYLITLVKEVYHSTFNDIPIGGRKQWVAAIRKIDFNEPLNLPSNTCLFAPRTGNARHLVELNPMSVTFNWVDLAFNYNLQEIQLNPAIVVNALFDKLLKVADEAVTKACVAHLQETN